MLVITFAASPGDRSIAGPIKGSHFLQLYTMASLVSLMTKAKTVGAIVGIIGSVGCVVSAARLTLPELAKLNAPNPVLIERMRELLPEPFDQIVKGADVIVRGTVTPVRTYLSEDQYEVYTDYQLTPVHVVFQKASVGTAAPGIISEPITIARWGGTLTIDGVQVTLSDRDAPSFEATADMVVFLAYDGLRRRYRLVSEVAGAFRSQNGVIEPLVKHERYQRFRGMTFERFETEVRRSRQ